MEPVSVRGTEQFPILRFRIRGPPPTQFFRYLKSARALRLLVLRVDVTAELVVRLAVLETLYFVSVLLVRACSVAKINYFGEN